MGKAGLRTFGAQLKNYKNCYSKLSTAEQRMSRPFLMPDALLGTIIKVSSHFVGGI
jgi:hypothetical protein